MSNDGDDVDLLADIAEIKATPESLSKLNDLVAEAQALESEINDLEIQLGLTKKQYLTVIDHKIPTAMLSAGVQKFSTTDGHSVAIEKKYQAHISEANQEKAYKWLDDNGHQAIIKHMVSIQFDRSQHNEALSLVGELRERDLPVADKQSVHPSTLKAFVREQLESGKDLPQDTFGVYVIDRAVIK